MSPEEAASLNAQEEREARKDEILDTIKQLLNEAIEAEPGSLNEMFTHFYASYPGSALEDHPHIPVRSWTDDPEWEEGHDPLRVTALGLINGIVHALTGEKLIAVYNTAGELVKMVRRGELEG